MAKEVTRHIGTPVERELWGRSAGRCQFDGCNKPLYKSPVTQERVNIAEKAHIYSFSKDGPRGWGPLITNRSALNDIENLLLVCHDCHKTIDADKNGAKYSADLLQTWKRRHEARIFTVSGVCPTKKSFVTFYGSNIGEQSSPIQIADAMTAMFPDWYPAEETPIGLSMSCSHEDRSADFWKTESEHLKRIFERQIAPRILNGTEAHFSVFALAPQPLLIQLGALFTDKVSVEVYQPIREPKTWNRQPHPEDFAFTIEEPDRFDHPPALVLSMSDDISSSRITSVVGDQVSIWRLSVTNGHQHNDAIRSADQLAQFRTILRKLMVSIKKVHGNTTPLRIFPCMPVSCAIELGRIRMPKADMTWQIFDQNNKEKRFIETISIGDSN